MRLLLALLFALPSPAAAMGYSVSKARASSGHELNVVRMAGLVDNGEWAGWMQALSRTDPGLDTLFVVDSPGGAVPGGFFLLGKVEAYLAERAAAGRRDAVLVEKQCSSMCIPFYYAFPSRYARAEASFGFHGVSLGGLADDAEQTGLYLRRLTGPAAARGDADLLRWVEEAKSRSMFSTHALTRLSAAELVEQRAGLVPASGLVPSSGDALERLAAGL